MRFPIGILFWVVLVACRQTAPTPNPYPNPVPQTVIVAAAASAPPAAVHLQAPSAPPALASRSIQGITFEGIAFDSRSHRLIVDDQSGGPGSRHADAASAGRAAGGIAAINASYFTPEGVPLGLVVSSGESAGSWNSRSALGSGVWYDDSSGNPAITRRESLGTASARDMRELIQAGPMLVENGGAVAGLEATRPAIRTLIAWDGGTRWWIGRTSPCTLAELGKALAEGSPAGWPVRHALNLDGGRSSDLWVSSSVPGGPLIRRSAWNRPVRNFLVLVPN